MIKVILELLEYANGETENIRIAQGSHYLPEKFKEVIRLLKKENKWK